ncbi:MAG: BolA family transcriptional regulator, partial [Cellvibrionales bacterium]|nr:BolA family transcriptional regulator [Cellvibrionales bacterium]
MDTESVTALLQAAFPGASVSVELSGGHCNVQVISDEFD